MTACFLLERTGDKRRWLRRYGRDDPSTDCSFHDALFPLGDTAGEEDVPHDDERWPLICEECGYAFADEDEFQVFTLNLYSVVASVDEEVVPVGSIFHAHANERFEGAAPPGAMWDAHWLTERMEAWDPAKPWHVFGPGADGRVLIVRLPNRHDWIVDSRASNCGRPDDNTHRCWVRHGDAPNVTVDKGGDTCSAGAGSIQGGDYHGFLRAGRLT